MVQTLRRRRVSREKVRLLKTIAAQVAVIIAQGRILEDLRTKEEEREEYRERMVEALESPQGVRGARWSCRARGAPATAPCGSRGFRRHRVSDRGRTHLLLPAVRLAEIEERKNE